MINQMIAAALDARRFLNLKSSSLSSRQGSMTNDRNGFRLGIACMLALLTVIMVIMVLRECHKCKQTLHLSSFSSAGNGKIQTTCKACASNTAREYYWANRDRVLANVRLYRSLNLGVIKVRGKAWRSKNEATIKESKRQYAREHSEALSAKSRAWYAANKKVAVERQRQYYIANVKRIRENILAWQKANPDKYRAVRIATKQRRRARERGADGSYSAADIRTLLKAQNCLCAACQRNITKDYSVDHVMPLARGGSNDPSNLQLLCVPCNATKGAMHPDDWAARIGNLFV